MNNGKSSRNHYTLYRWLPKWVTYTFVFFNKEHFIHHPDSWSHPWDFTYKSFILSQWLYSLFHFSCSVITDTFAFLLLFLRTLMTISQGTCFSYHSPSHSVMCKHLSLSSSLSQRFLCFFLSLTSSTMVSVGENFTMEYSILWIVLLSSAIVIFHMTA